MSSGEKVLNISSQKYPFGENPYFSKMRVEQMQQFSSLENLLEKQSEMLRKRQMITNPAIIGLLSVLKKGMSLLYEWQYVPHSISSYVRSKFNTANSDIWQMTRTLLVKKVTYELTILMSYLAKMKIETELSMHTLGISYDEKLKLYLNPRSKMGIRSQLFLISHYGQAKERILKELQAELDAIQNITHHPHLHGKEHRPSFQSKVLNSSIDEASTYKSCIRNDFGDKSKRESKKNIEELPMRRKMSACNLDLGFNNDQKPLFEREKIKSPHTPRQHKYSFQFNNNCDQQSDLFNQFAEDTQKDAIINHTKSIRIELEQKQDMNKQRKRKDSYKLKITTFREYEVDDPSMFQQNGENEDDIFDYFAKKARKEEQQQHHQPRSPQKKEGLNTTAPSSPPLSPQFSHSHSQNLQQRVRQARQRSQRILVKMKSMKK